MNIIRVDITDCDLDVFNKMSNVYDFELSYKPSFSINLTPNKAKLLMNMWLVEDLPMHLSFHNNIFD